MLRFFTRLQQNERGRTELDVMLSDHPSSADRAEAIRREMATVTISAPAVVQTPQFHAMQTTFKLMPQAPAKAEKPKGNTGQCGLFPFC
jgi:predicted Zn-dependent protease